MSTRPGNIILAHNDSTLQDRDEITETPHDTAILLISNAVTEMLLYIKNYFIILLVLVVILLYNVISVLPRHTLIMSN